MVQISAHILLLLLFLLFQPINSLNLLNLNIPSALLSRRHSNIFSRLFSSISSGIDESKISLVDDWTLPIHTEEARTSSLFNKNNLHHQPRPLAPHELAMFTRKSNIFGSVQFVSHVLWLAFCWRLSVIAPIKAIRILATILHGYALVTLGHCAQHECIHNTAFSSRTANRIISWLVSLPRLTNPTHEALLHRRHHMYTNSPDMDPELTCRSPRNTVPTSLSSYLLSILRIGSGPLGLGVWASRAGILVNCALSRPVGYSGFDTLPDEIASASARRDLEKSTRMQLLFYALCSVALTFSSKWQVLIRYHILPLLLGEPLHAMHHIADHMNCNSNHRDWTRNTRTTVASSFIQFNLWNMNYHAEHHLYPSIPFHQLPKLHKYLLQEKNGPLEMLSTSWVQLHRNIINWWMPYASERRGRMGERGLDEAWEPCELSYA